MKVSYIAGVFGVLFVVFLCLNPFRLVVDGNVGVKHVLGHISDDPMPTGFHIVMPVITKVETWNIKTQEVKATADVPSSEGLISTLDVSVLFNIPKGNAPTIRKTIGEDYINVVVQPIVRETIRSVASGYQVKSLFSEDGRAKISAQMKQILEDKLGGRGIVIQDVLLRDVKLPNSFKESIENKLKAEQESLQKEFELEKAKKDADIEVARAEGVAKANEIIAGSITESYLRYLFVQGLNDGNTEVIYVPTEANLPILEARDNR